MNRKFIETMKNTSFRKQIVDPYVDRMELKEAVESEKIILRCQDKAMWVMIMFLIAIFITAGMIFAWVWCMDFFGFFPYVSGDKDPIFLGVMVLLPMMTMFGYTIAMGEYRAAISKRIKKIAGVDDDESPDNSTETGQ